jgi:hypothetical protein
MPRHKKTDLIFEEIEKRVAHSDLLSPLEKEETLARAKAHVEEQRKKQAIDSLFEHAVKAEQNAYDPNEEIVEFTVDLPDFSPCITINGFMSYYHGCTYKVPMQLYRSLIDLQWQANCHQREIEGHRRQGDINRRPQYTNLSPSSPHGRVTTTGNMRV